MRYLSRRSLARVFQVVLTVSWYIILARLVLEAVMIAAMHFGWWGDFLGLFRPLGEFASLLGAAHPSRSLYVPYYAHMSQSEAFLMLFRLLLVDLPSSLTTLYVIRVVRQMSSTLATDRPFIAENAARVRRIGLAFLALTAWNWLFKLLSLTAVPDPLPTLFGLLLLIMAEVFRHGAELQEDHDLTV